MRVEVPRRDLTGLFLDRLAGLWRPLRNLGAAPRPRVEGTRSLLTAAEFQEELAILGLSGRRFEPEDYSDALGDYLNISIAVHVIPDSWYPELSRLLALSGRLGELRYSEPMNLAAIFVPGSLPPLVLTLTILHELGHLAAGDLLIDPDEDDLDPEEATFETLPLKKGKKLARGNPFAAESLREREANLRASYALFAGCLGDENPYAHETCTTCYECGPTPGSRARERELRGFHRLPVFSRAQQKNQVQRLCGVQSAVRGADVRRRGPRRPLRRAGGDHARGHDGVAHSTHSSVGMPRPGRRPARATRQPSGGAGGAEALVAINARVGAARAAALRRPGHRCRAYLAITGH